MEQKGKRLMDGQQCDNYGAVRGISRINGNGKNAIIFF